MSAPPGQKPVITTVHNTTYVPAAKDSMPVTTDTPMNRLRRFQQSCQGQGKELGKDCLAYNQLVSDMAKRNFGCNVTDQIFSQELSRAVTPQEDLCSNLTELMKHLPSQLMHVVLKPFTLSPHCVSWCYQSQGDEEYTVKDSCRVFNNLHSDVNNPAPILDSPKTNEEETVVKETNKHEQIAPQKPQEQPAIPPQEPLEKGANDDDGGEPDSEEGDVDEKESDNPTQDLNGPVNSNESPRGSAETDNDISIPDDAELRVKVIDKDTAPEKKHLPKVETPEQLEVSKTSDIIMQGSDPFYNQNDSNFFSYFLFAMFSCAILYVAYHNKSKLMALVVEGRRTSSGRGGFSKGRKHTAAYRKLDSNLEEAITSGSTSGAHSSSQIIY
uniref:Uncharacterized protein n=1 Tax=Anopheles atroparvus TaxID=41427 RepID=A0A182J2A5_ANOAO